MKKIKRGFALAMGIMTSLSVCPFGACGGLGTKVTGINENQTQLYIAVTEGGSGRKWFNDLKAAFEAEYAQTEFETGKMGVQIMETWGKEEFAAGTVETDLVSGSKDYNIYIGSLNYASCVSKELLLDITDIVNEKAEESETKTIAGKMNADYQKYYANTYLDETHKNYNHYFGLPTNDAVVGINYDVDLFDDRNWYFYENGFKGSGTRAAGPDGISGTTDDGLPSTFDEFKQLVNAITVTPNVTPFTWTSISGYLNDFLTSVFAADAGYSEFNANTNFSGTATLDDGSQIEVTNENGWKLATQKGKKYVVEVAMFLSQDERYYSEKAFDTNQSHIKAQEEFVWSADPDASTRYAMIIEGSWWENEAESTNTFTTMVDRNGKDYAFGTRRYGFMPFPKRNGPVEGEGNTLLSTTDQGIIAINAKVKGTPQERLAKEFLRFFVRNSTMSKYTGATGCIRPFEYELMDVDYQNMTPYAKNVYDLYTEENTKICHYNLTDNIMKINEKTYLYGLLTFVSKVGDGKTAVEYNNFVGNFKNNSSLTVADVYAGMAAKFTEADWKRTLSQYIGG